MPFASEKLDAYRTSVGLAADVCLATRGFPRGYYFLANQLNRAALSIAANIAEGNGRFTAADRGNFLAIARGSVQECVALLEIAARRRVLTPETHARLRDQLIAIGHMVAGLIKSVDKRRAPGTLPRAQRD